MANYDKIIDFELLQLYDEKIKNYIVEQAPIVEGVYKFKGSVNEYSQLPALAEVGDVYNVVNLNGMNFSWTGSQWDALGAELVGKRGSVNSAEIFNDYSRNTATAIYAHAEGANTHATGANSHTEGWGTHATNNNAHAEGGGTHAEGADSHTEGNSTYATANTAHAEGYATRAEAAQSHAGGDHSNAKHAVSFVHGSYVNSSRTNQAVFGQYNADDTEALFIVGNGSSNNRKNAFKVNIDGTAYAGDKKILVEGDVSDNGSSVGQQGAGITDEIFNGYSGNGLNTASGGYTHAEGYATKATNNNAHAEGNSTEASGEHSHAEGYFTIASANQTHAEGANTKATASAAHAEGYQTAAEGNFSHAEGAYNKATGGSSHVEGGHARTADQLTRRGGRNIAAGGSAHAEGISTCAGSEFNHLGAHAEGAYTKALAPYAHAEGCGYIGDISYQGSMSPAEGETQKTNICIIPSLASEFRSVGDILILQSIEEPDKEYDVTIQEIKDDGSLVLDLSFGINFTFNAKRVYPTTANGKASHTEGYGTYATNDFTHAEGNRARATGDWAHAEGGYSIAQGSAAHAEGGHVKDRNNDIYIGGGTNAIGGASHSEGMTTQAGSEFTHYGAHAEGVFTKALGEGAHAEGAGFIISLPFTAEGGDEHPNAKVGEATNAFTISFHSDEEADSFSSYLSLGDVVRFTELSLPTKSFDAQIENISVGGYASCRIKNSLLKYGTSYSISKVIFNEAQGKASHVSGIGTKATADAQTVIGKFNETNDDALFIVGNGTSDTRSNAFTVDTDGNAYAGNGGKLITASEKGLFSNALKGNISGEVISIIDVSPIVHEMGVKVESKNLISYPYYNTSKTENGVTITDNGDGSLTLNGTASGSIIFYLQNKPTLSEGTYTISGGTTDIVVYARKNATTWIETGSGAPSTGVVNKGDVINMIGVLINSGKTFDNVTIYPQIEKGTVATAYTPYIEDISVVRMYAQGKNLFNNDTSLIKKLNYTGRDGSKYTRCGYEIHLPAGEYVLSVKTNVTNRYIYTCVNDTEGNFITDAMYTLEGTIKTDGYVVAAANIHPVVYKLKENYVIYIYDGVDENEENAKVVFSLMQIQLENGKVITEYEPFIEPIEYTVAADGTVKGVNSIYPNITLTTDTHGALISAEYNRDLNKAFAELYNAIISMGGNV